MTSPVEWMVGWPMALFYIGFYAMFLVFLILRERKRGSSKNRYLDTSQPPSWWEWEDWSDPFQVQASSKDEENAG